MMEEYLRWVKFNIEMFFYKDDLWGWEEIVQRWIRFVVIGVVSNEMQ